MGDLASVIAKIQKLRRLETSSNVNEAAAAAAAADRLIQEHGLCEAQLEADGAPREGPIEADEPVAVFLNTIPSWQLKLLIVLARHYDCAIFAESWRAPKGRGPRQKIEQIKMVGRKDDTESMRFMYSALVLEIERLAGLKGGAPPGMPPDVFAKLPRGRIWLNSFRHGAVHGVSQALAQSKRDARVSMCVSSTALAIYDRKLEEAETLKGKMDFDGKKRLSSTKMDSHGFVRGMQAGRDLPHQASARKLSGGKGGEP